MRKRLLFLTRVGRYPLARWARAKDMSSGIVYAAAKARYFAARFLQHGHWRPVTARRLFVYSDRQSPLFYDSSSFSLV